MKRFADLYAALDETTKTNVKVAALEAYFRDAPAEDAAWAVHFLSGNRPKRLVGPARLRAWAAEAAGIPPWLFEECYQTVGDLAETVALLLPGREEPSPLPLHRWVEDRLLPLRGLDEEEQKARVMDAWAELTSRQLFLWNKLLTGSFRVGVSQRLVVRALGRMSGVEEAALAHRLMGRWQPNALAYRALFDPDTADADVARPYPFFLAYPLEEEVAELGDRLGPVDDWQAEWKWDGIRGQLVRRGGQVFLWSRGEELVTERFPELSEAGKLLPDGTVLDGEVLPLGAEGRALPFAELQRRIGRKKLGPKILREVPAYLIAYDLLEEAGEDLRELPLAERRERLRSLLAGLVGTDRLRLSPTVGAESWAQMAERKAAARDEEAEGLMLKRRDSPYGVGRKKGDWWKWKVNPFTVDAVLLYAQRGHGRRASLYTDYTFAVWRDFDPSVDASGEEAGGGSGGGNGRRELVPFAKAYSGLTDKEIRRVDNFVRRNTLERFGPVRSVKPELVFEIAFEGIRRSSRHKSGIAVRFPRMSRWREDKKPEDADSLDTLQELLPDPR